MWVCHAEWPILRNIWSVGDLRGDVCHPAKPPKCVQLVNLPSLSIHAGHWQTLSYTHLQLMNWICLHFNFSVLTDASLLALTAQAAQEAEGAHTFTPSWTIPCRNTPLPTVPGPRKCTVRSAHTGQANWTFGVQPALAWYKLHSVSAPSQINCMHNYSCDATQPIKSVLLSIVIWVR